VFRGGGEVAADGVELLSSGEGAQASRHLLPQFDHADLALAGIIVEGNPVVGDEPQVVALAVAQPPGRRMMFAF